METLSIVKKPASTKKPAPTEEEKREQKKASREKWAKGLTAAVLGLGILLVLVTLGSLCLTAQTNNFKGSGVSGTPTAAPTATQSPDETASEKLEERLEARQAAAEKRQSDRIADAIAVMKDRAAGQQTVIGALTTLTGLYTVILALAAYVRLQQSRADTVDTIAKITKDVAELKDDMGKRVGRAEKDSVETLDKVRIGAATLRTDLDDRFQKTEVRLKELIEEVRHDIPAVQGIGRRLEQLGAQLRSRLPIDADWTEPDTYARLGVDQLEQVLIDEMVINSLDIFDIKIDVGNRRTISSLYLSLGQFYFGRASSLRAIPQQKPAATQSLARTTIYLTKAVEVDDTNAVAQRARGVASIYSALWKQEDYGSPTLDAILLDEASFYIGKSLAANPDEPGALFADSWLLRRKNKLDASIERLDHVIAVKEKLTGVYRRKFLYSAYLNRATNRAFRLSAMTSPPAELIASEAALVQSDCEEAFNAATHYQRKERFQLELKREVQPKGDLIALYTTTKTLHDLIDRALAS
jgi:hypothetical protein